MCMYWTVSSLIYTYSRFNRHKLPRLHKNYLVTYSNFILVYSRGDTPCVACKSQPAKIQPVLKYRLEQPQPSETAWYIFCFGQPRESRLSSGSSLVVRTWNTLKGSFSCTSSAAARMRPCLSAPASPSSSTSPPRAVFTRNAPADTNTHINTTSPHNCPFLTSLNYPNWHFICTLICIFLIKPVFQTLIISNFDKCNVHISIF